MEKTLDPLTVLKKGHQDLSSLERLERMVFILLTFETLMDMEGWDHFFLYEHDFALYPELRESLHTIGDSESTAVLVDFENHLRSKGVRLALPEYEAFLNTYDDAYRASCRDWRGEISETNRTAVDQGGSLSETRRSLASTVAAKKKSSAKNGM